MDVGNSYLEITSEWPVNGDQCGNAPTIGLLQGLSANIRLVATWYTFGLETFDNSCARSDSSGDLETCL
jgi:hypothetical protein